MSIREAYQNSLHRDGHRRDAAQAAVIERLGELQSRLLAGPVRRSFADRILGCRTAAAQPVRGLYLWGGVGRGKTFLMDLFFESLAVEAKRRVHFHRIMHEVHERLAALDDVQDPIDRAALEIARDLRVLCFDEFFVADIGDAMILAKLLDGLFRRGVTLVATSNSKPDDLYRDGLQRSRFLPAIELLKTHTTVLRLDGDTDYRLRILRQAGTYLTPDGDTARGRLRRLFDDSASSRIRDAAPLDINGRQILARHCARGIAWFDFSELCDGPRSQNDYIEIARWYPTVIVSAVPCFDRSLEDQARRFVALVDEFYDRNVKLIVSAAAAPADLYRGLRLRFEFERTASRLVEMQSADYLALPHLA